MILLGPFELIGPCGKGGMGQVWRGRHLAEQTPVAVKVITARGASDPVHRAFFRREVQAVAGLHHAGIVTVFDYGEVSPETSRASGGAIVEGSPYLVMEFAAGGTLHEHRITSWHALSQILLQVLDALACAHARGMIHRDLKPENVLCCAGASTQPRWVLADFGIAHALGAIRDLETKRLEGASAGTPWYMPPEQLLGHWREGGAWSDLYSLGCVAFELISGRVPFEAQNLVKIAQMHLHEPVPKLAPRFPVPEGTEAWIRRLMAKAPRDRFRHAADAAWALASLGAPSSPEALAPQAAGEAVERVRIETLQEGCHTLVHSPANTVLVPHLGALEVVAAPAGEVDPFEPPPPIPQTWDFTRAEPPTDQLVGAGLGLFGLRSVPLVGRVAERDAIWEALLEVVEARVPRAVIVQGPSGCGKSKLARWMARRADETGAARVLMATHNQRDNGPEAIARMLETWSVTWRLDRQETYERFRELLPKLDPALAAKGHRRTLETEARALAEIVRGSGQPESPGDGPGFYFSSRSERDGFVIRLLRHLAQERPLVVLLDDLQWGPDALRFMTSTLAGAPDLPVLFLATVREEALVDDQGMAQRLDALALRDEVLSLRLAALPAEDHLELVRRLLPLEPALREEVAWRTQGHPIFAVQLIEDWVDRGLLQSREGGFGIRDAAEIVLPDNIHQLWMSRIEQLLRRFVPDERPRRRVSLELAACLGQHVSEREWQSVAASCGVPADDRLVDAMVQIGLAERHPTGWSFGHGMLCESLQRAAAEAARAQSHHRRCAEMIAQLYPEQLAEQGYRRAEHLVQGGRPFEALAPLLAYSASAQQADAIGDLRRGLVRFEEIADAHAVPGEHPLRLEHELRWLRLHRRDDAAFRAELAELIEQIEGAEGLDRLLCWAYHLEAQILSDAGELDAAVSCLRRAEPVARRCEGSDAAGEWAFMMGDVCFRRGEWALAAEYFSRAAEASARSGAEAFEIHSLTRLGHVLLEQGEVEQARRQMAVAVHRARALGIVWVEASSLNDLGDVARRQGRWDEARDHYARAQALWEQLGSDSRVIALLNRALTEVAAAASDETLPLIDEAEQALVEVGYSVYVPLLELGRACCAAACGRWTDFDDLLQRGIEGIEASGLRSAEVAELVEQAAAMAASQGQDARAQYAREVAAEHWRGLGDVARAEALVGKQ